MFARCDVNFPRYGLQSLFLVTQNQRKQTQTPASEFFGYSFIHECPIFSFKSHSEVAEGLSLMLNLAVEKVLIVMTSLKKKRNGENFQSKLSVSCH